MTTAVAVGLVAPSGHDEDGQPVALANTDACPEAKVTRSELLALMIRAVNGLPAEEGELVKRHYFDGERFDTIATELGLSKSWASRLHTRALRRLAKRMGNVA